MYTFTIPRDEFDELRPDKQMIRKLIGKHIGLVGRLKKNMNYYRGKHKILDDENRENKLVCNHAKDISDTASSIRRDQLDSKQYYKAGAIYWCICDYFLL